MKFTVSLLLVLTLFSGQILCQRNFRQVRQQICYTPENYYGICVVLTQCPSLVNYYGQSRGSQQAVQYLYQVQRSCGTRSVANDPVVCCEEAYNNYYRPTPQPTTPRNPFTQIPTRPTPPPPATQPPTQPPPPPTQPPTRPPPPATQPPPPPTQPPTPPPVNNRATNCRGPDLRPGNCVDVRNCEELLNALVNDSRNSTVQNFLRLSNEICRNSGYVAGTSVCCPIEETTSNPRTNPDNGAVSLNGPECGLSSVFKFRRVVGGEPSELGTWPWITLLGYDVLEGSPFKCGGSLITKRHVLTAAHCIRSDLKFIRLGEHDLGSTTETTTVDINIVKMDRHPQYNSRNGKNDIAILHLESPVSYTERIHPACLPKDPPLRTRSFVDYMPFVAGWGRTQEGGKSAEVLQQLQLPVLENQVCRDRYAAQRRLVTEDQFDEATICAGVLTGGMDTCQGDSGGPLMYPEQENQNFRFYVIGVVSYGVGCARAEIPGVYTNVANFIDWIEQKIAA